MGSAFAGANEMVDGDATLAIEHPAVAPARIDGTRGENVVNFPTSKRGRANGRYATQRRDPHDPPN